MSQRDDIQQQFVDDTDGSDDDGINDALRFLTCQTLPFLRNEKYVPLRGNEKFLSKAAEEGDAGAVVALLKEESLNRNPRNDFGWAPIQLAALQGHTSVVQAFLDHGVDVDERVLKAEDTSLHIAASWGRVETVKLLLERGANPYLTNVSGKTALASADGHTPIDAANMKQVKQLLEAAMSRSAAPSRTAKSQEGCGHCNATNVKLLMCNGCRLKWYCSGACQKTDWPNHKQRCRQVREVLQLADTIGNPSLDPQIRLAAVRRLDDDPLMRQMAVENKEIVKKLVAKISGDKPVNTWNDTLYPTVRALAILTRKEELGVVGKRTTKCNKPAVQQFVDAEGVVQLLRKLTSAGCPGDEVVNGMRMLGAMVNAGVNGQVCTSNILKLGQGEEVVNLLSVLLRSRLHAVVAQTAAVLAALIAQECRDHMSSLKQQHQEAAGPLGGSSENAHPNMPSRAGVGAGCDSGDGSVERCAGCEVLPLCGQVFRCVDLMKMTEATGGGGEGPLQAGMEFFLAACHHPPSLRTLLSSHPFQMVQLAELFLCGLFFQSEDGWSTSLHWLALGCTNNNFLDNTLPQVVDHLPVSPAVPQELSLQCIARQLLTFLGQGSPAKSRNYTFDSDNAANALTVLHAMAHIRAVDFHMAFSYHYAEFDAALHGAEDMRHREELKQFFVEHQRVFRSYANGILQGGGDQPTRPTAANRKKKRGNRRGG